MKRISGFDDGKQYELFRCEQWFYDTLSDGNNFAKLRQGDKDRVKKIVGERPFFLHRFTPLEKKGVVYEIFVSHDGASVVGSRMQVVESGQK